MQDLISVVVPVYNKEQYLGRCFDAIRAQSYRSLEILLVDDCSTDGSLALCRAFAAADQRVKLFECRINGGASSARNIALDSASGAYVAFFDADDEAQPDMLLTLYEALTANHADVACGGVEYIHGDGSLSRTAGLSGKTERLSHNAAMRRLLSEFPREEHLEIANWNKLYTRSIIGDTRFAVGYCSEDYLFNYDVFKKCRSVVSVGLPLYRNHIDVKNSFSRSMLSEKNITTLGANARICADVSENYPALLSAALIRYITVIAMTSVAATRTDRMPYRTARRAVLENCRAAKRLLPRCPDGTAAKCFRNRMLDIYFPKMHKAVDKLYRKYRGLSPKK